MRTDLPENWLCQWHNAYCDIAGLSMCLKLHVTKKGICYTAVVIVDKKVQHVRYMVTRA